MCVYIYIYIYIYTIHTASFVPLLIQIDGMDSPDHYAAALCRFEPVVVFEIPVFAEVRLDSN